MRNAHKYRKVMCNTNFLHLEIILHYYYLSKNILNYVFLLEQERMNPRKQSVTGQVKTKMKN